MVLVGFWCVWGMFFWGGEGGQNEFPIVAKARLRLVTADLASDGASDESDRREARAARGFRLGRLRNPMKTKGA